MTAENCGIGAVHGIILKFDIEIYVMILSFRTDRSGQTVQTLIRLLSEEQSDQGLHSSQFCLHHWVHYPLVKPLG